MSSSDNNCKSSPVSSAALLGIVWVLLTGGVLLSGFFLIFTIRFRRNRIVKMSSPNLNVVTLLGSSLTYGSAYLFGIEKQNRLSGPSVEMLIQMRICLLCIGGSLVFGPILGKSWRLYKVFTQRVPDKRVNIKDQQLLIMVGALVGADIVLLSAWIFLDPVQCLQNLNADMTVTAKGLACIVYRGYFCMSLYSDLWLFLFLGFKGVLLMYGAYLAGLTYDVSCPPVNQSLTLIVGITVIFLSAKIALVVNRFFHSWHNLVFGTISGGIFVCTTTMNCLIFTPQVRQLKAFENQNEGISHVAKFFTSSSKNFHSTVYSEEEIGQLIGEKNTMMHLLAEKDTAIAILQEQVSSAKEKLTKLVAAEDGREAADSPFPSASFCPWDLSAADCSSKATEDTPRDLSLPGQEPNTWQILQLSNSPCIPRSSNKKDCVGDPQCTSQPNLPLEFPNRCRLLSSAKNISDCSGGPGDCHKWLFQYAAPCSTGALQEPLRKNLSTPRVGAEQAQVRPQFPGISYVSSDKLQEVLQELNTDHTAGSQTATKEAEQSAACGWSTGGWPQESQATTLTRLSPFKIEAERKIPTCLPGSTVPDAWCTANSRASRRQRSHSKISQFPWATASDTTEQRALHQPLSFPSSAFKSRLSYKAENGPEHPSREENSWLLDKRPMENYAPPLCPGSPMTFHHQPRDFASHTAHLYLDSDSSSTTSSGGARCCHHRHCCDLCHHSLSSSSDDCSTDMDSEPGISLYCGSNLLGKPQPIVNFNEDLEPTYV